MNEDFLIHLQKSPRPEFAAELYRKINQPAPAGPSLALRAALAASALCAAVAVTSFISPAARAAVLSLIREIGGVSFFETADYPGIDNPTIVPEKILSLAEAQAELPFSISLPIWVPEGYVRDDNVRITRFSNAYTPVTITWRGKSADGSDTLLELMIGQTIGDWIVGWNSLETVKIKGQDASLIRGMWNSNTKEWDENPETIGLTLIWAKGETTYSLFSPTLSRAELIRIAESIP